MPYFGGMPGKPKAGKPKASKPKAKAKGGKKAARPMK
jgi:hypothetical protein